MRNPNRIKPMIAELEAFWQQNPDLRLGQIIENAHRAARNTPQSDNRFDLYNMEDSQLLTGLTILRKMCNVARRGA